MQRLMKCCARGALGLGAAALLLAGVPAHAGSSAGAPAIEPRLMAQSTAQPEEAEKLEKRRLEEQRKKMEQQQQRGKTTTGATQADEDAGGRAGGGAGPGCGDAQNRQVAIRRRGCPG